MKVNEEEKRNGIEKTNDKGKTKKNKKIIIAICFVVVAALLWFVVFPYLAMTPMY